MELSLITIAASDSAWNSNEVVILLLRETFMYVGVDPHEMDLICADDNTDFIHVCICFDWCHILNRRVFLNINDDFCTNLQAPLLWRYRCQNFDNPKAKHRCRVK